MLVLGLALLGSLITALKAAKLSLLLLQDKHPISFLKEMAALGQLGLWSSCIVRQFGVPERLKTKLGERIKSERGTPVRAEHKPTFRSRNARREDGRAAIAQPTPRCGCSEPHAPPARTCTLPHGRSRPLEVTSRFPHQPRLSNFPPAAASSRAGTSAPFAGALRSCQRCSSPQPA